MHSTETPRTASVRHRLYVVLPLFLVLAVIGTGSRSTASVLAEQTHTQSGTLIAGKDFIGVDVGGFHLQGWNGAFEADDHNPAALTLAALTTPVLATRADDTWLVPVGMQLTINRSAVHPSILSRRPLPLPAHYLLERLPDAERLLATLSLPAVTEPSTLTPPLVDAPVQLERARAEAEQGDRVHRLWQLSDALIRGDLAAFDTLIAEPRTTIALQGADLRTLFTLAFTAKRDLHILPSLLQDARTATILRFHPLTRDRIWLAADTQSHIDLLLLAQALQPLSDRAPESSASDIAMRAWQEGWEVLSASGAVAPEVLHVVIPSVAADITALDEAGYPARARAYASALVHGVQTSGTSSVDTALATLRSVYDVSLAITASLTTVPEPVSQPTEAASSSSVSSAHPVVPEVDVRAMLTTEGCMFTSQSVLHLREDGFYDITGIVIGTPAGDRLIDFTFDPRGGLVSGIEQNGEILPYSLTLPKYLEWVKGE